jgi:tol-pal system protein YbgF
MRTFLYLILVGSLGGCGADSRARTELTDVRRQLDTMRHRLERDQKIMRELDNRLFLVEDKLDTVRVGSLRSPEATPRLPVVKKARPEAAPKSYSGPAPGEDGETVIVYEGDAAKDEGPRPFLGVREAKAEPERIPVRETASDLPDPSAVEDRIPTAPLPERAARAAPPHPVVDDPIVLYREAYAALRKRQHQAAITGFQEFLEHYAEHDYADNAQYWLAEVFYDQRDFPAALGEFRNVVVRYPSGNKAPDALVKVGYCYAQLGEVESARDVLAQVVEIYPKTDAAKLAVKRLEELRK